MDKITLTQILLERAHRRLERAAEAIMRAQEHTARAAEIWGAQ